MTTTHKSPSLVQHLTGGPALTTTRLRDRGVHLLLKGGTGQHVVLEEVVLGLQGVDGGEEEEEEGQHADRTHLFTRISSQQNKQGAQA